MLKVEMKYCDSNNDTKDVDFIVAKLEEYEG